MQIYGELPRFAEIDLCNFVFGEHIWAALNGAPLCDRTAQLRLCCGRFSGFIAGRGSAALAGCVAIMREKLRSCEPLLAAYMRKCAGVDSDKVELALCLMVECDQTGFYTDITYENGMSVLWVYMGRDMSGALLPVPVYAGLADYPLGLRPCCGDSCCPIAALASLHIADPTNAVNLDVHCRF